MEQLLEMAKKVCDQAEIFALEDTSIGVSFENAALHDIATDMESGFSLRIIKDGKLGFAYTRNLLDREEFLQNALNSLEGGVEAGYEFPLTTDVRQLSTYDVSAESITSTVLVEECRRVCDILSARTDGEIMAGAHVFTGAQRLINSAGSDLSTRFSGAGIHGEVIFPGTGQGIGRFHSQKGFQPLPDALIEEIISWYTRAARDVTPKGGKMKVLFMPQSLYTLTWRIKSGTGAKSVYDKISPIAEKVGQRIFDSKLTLISDPLDDRHPGARAFDDEGVPCATFPIIHDGVLNSLYYDLNYAHKLSAASTGHGFKTQQWGGDVFSMKPTPSLSHLVIKPGDTAFADLVKSMNKGLIVEGALGAHSGNIPNGDYSIGADPAFYVENGEIVGRAKDVMVAGNIYDTLNNIIALENTLHRGGGGGWVPAILCDNVSVSAKG